MDQLSPISAQGSKASRTMSTLNNSIETLKIAKDMIPLELGKGVLSAFEGILTLVRDTIKNKEDFSEIITQCHRLSFIIWRATSETPAHEISDSTKRALVDLEGSVDGIRDSLTFQANRGIGSRVFHVAIDREQIAAWTRDMDRYLLLFNTELHIMTNLKIDEISKVLHNARFAEKKTVPEPIPAIPAIFFGRDEIVREVAKALTSGTHVALIGPGGMGKSCISRAVLHDRAISNKYSDNRYFIRYDDMNPSHVTLSTFLDRIARALDIKSSRVNQLSVLSNFLTSQNVLLVFDNAEVFLDAATDAGRIAETLDGFAALPGVDIMLTTRTKALPANLICKRISVPPLDENSAQAAFSAVYQASLPSQVITKLLGSLDFHPLSINLLAQAASQNEWSLEKLVESWEQQKACLLEIGQGKVQSLAVTIKLSLNSPSLQLLGSSTLHFLQIAAFLPQGVDERKLEDLFPGISDITTVVSKLAKQSLVYYSGNFITMLAPIRLYISGQYNAITGAILPLKHIRTYYRERLSKTTDVTEFIEKNTVILDEGILSEDLNVEHLVNHDLVSSQNKLKSLSFCLAYLKNLRKARHPRPTALRTAILSISNSDLEQIHFLNFHLNN
ncbi:P-loop containing nucleoside triphosphate hydrolase protein, partial [Collybia nuda]